MRAAASNKASSKGALADRSDHETDEPPSKRSRKSGIAPVAPPVFRTPRRQSVTSACVHMRLCPSGNDPDAKVPGNTATTATTSSANVVQTWDIALRLPLQECWSKADRDLMFPPGAKVGPGGLFRTREDSSYYAEVARGTLLVVTAGTVNAFAGSGDGGRGGNWRGLRAVLEEHSDVMSGVARHCTNLRALCCEAVEFKDEKDGKGREIHRKDLEDLEGPQELVFRGWRNPDQETQTDDWYPGFAVLDRLAATEPRFSGFGFAEFLLNAALRKVDSDCTLGPVYVPCSAGLELEGGDPGGGSAAAGRGESLLLGDGKNRCPRLLAEEALGRCGFMKIRTCEEEEGFFASQVSGSSSSVGELPSLGRARSGHSYYMVRGAHTVGVEKEYCLCLR